MIGRTNAVTLQGGAPATGDIPVRYIDINGDVLKTDMVNSGTNSTPPPTPSYDSNRLLFHSYNQVYTNITVPTDVGAIYNTIDGKTYLFIRITNPGYVAPTLYLNKSDSSTLTIDWGDSTQSTFTNTGNFNTGAHTYTVKNNYIITMWISSGTGTYSFGNGSLTTTLFGNTQDYKDILYKIYTGLNVTTITAFAFNSFKSLRIISFSPLITSIGQQAIYAIDKLIAFICPNIDNIGIYQLQSSYLLKYFVVSNAMTYLTQVINNCNLDINIPKNITTLSYYSIYNLVTNVLRLPSSVTSLVGAIGRSCTMNEFIIPSSVTSISGDDFCRDAYIDAIIFEGETPPTLSGSYNFYNMNYRLRIYVPDASYDAYIAAGYPSYGVYPYSMYLS